MPFKYLRDPVFMLCVAIYFGHRALRQWDLSPLVFQCHLNDLICTGFWLPPILWLHRMLGLRRHDGIPDREEILAATLVWAIAFEIVVPAIDGIGNYAAADPIDVLCYFLGSVMAMFAWRWHYSRSHEVADHNRAETCADLPLA